METQQNELLSLALALCILLSVIAILVILFSRLFKSEREREFSKEITSILENSFGGHYTVASEDVNKIVNVIRSLALSISAGDFAICSEHGKGLSPDDMVYNDSKIVFKSLDEDGEYPSLSIKREGNHTILCNETTEFELARFNIKFAMFTTMLKSLIKKFEK